MESRVETWHPLHPMFHGSIPADLRNLLAEVSQSWTCERVYVGCSGNFTIERVLAAKGPWALYSNDVQCYSCGIGSFLAQQDFPLLVREEMQDRFGWLTPFMQTPEGRTAVLMLCTRMLIGLNKEGHPYYDRIRQSYRDQWDRLFNKTVERLKTVPVKLAGCFIGDVVEYFQQADPAQAFVSFPPFFAKDYESQFAPLDDVFDWPKPEYPMMDEARKQALLEVMTSASHWLVGLHVERPNLRAHLRGIVQTTNRGVPIYVYAGSGAKRIVRPRQATTPVTVPRLMPGDTIGGRMTLAPLGAEQFQALRSQYMNPGIKPGQASLPIGVLVDGVLVGVFAFSTAPTVSRASFGIGPNIYLLSDFPVAPSDYPRLSKLVLYAALSQESKMLAERCSHERIRGVVTTAFSRRPVSMKYRGLFDLISRAETGEEHPEGVGTPDGYYAQGFKLNYGSAIGRWSLAGGLEEWKKKHGAKSGSAES